MANLSNINNKFIVTDGNNGRVLIGATNDIGATLFANHPSTTAPSLTFNAPAGQVFENEDLQFAFGLNNASPYNGYMQTRFVSAPYYRNLAINPLGGNVGIGTNSPGAKFDVVNYAQIDSYPANASGNNAFNSGYLKLIAGGKTGWGVGDELGKINFYGSDGSGIGARNAASIVAICENGNGTSTTTFSSGLAFFTSSYNANQSEKVRIDNDGNVGIGTATPNCKLDVKGVVNTTIIAATTLGDGGGAANRGLAIRTLTDGGEIITVGTSTNMYLNTASNLYLQNASNTKVTMLSSGNVGIDDTQPVTGKLVVKGDAYSISLSGQSRGGIDLKTTANGGPNAYSAGISFGGASSGRAAISGVQSPSGNDGDRQGLAFFTHGSGTGAADSAEAMRIQSDGNVGIGVTNPSAKLHVQGSANSGLAVMGVGTTATRVFAGLDGSNHGYLFLAGSSGQNAAKISATGGNSYISAGNVGIGITSPSTTLHVDASNLTNNVAVYIGGGFVSNDAYHKEGGLLVISGTHSNAQTSAGIAFQTRNTGETNYWKSSIIMNRDGALNFTLGGAGTGAGSDKLSIASHGTIKAPSLGGYTPTGADLRYDTSDGEIYYQTSSERYKTDIVNLESSLDKINLLRPVRYKDINTNEPACGLIAEEVVETIPEVVFKKEIEGFDKPQIEGLNYADLVPFLIKSIQELKAEIDELKK